MSDGLGVEFTWYRVVRERLDKQNELVNSRLSWLITSQSFLFTAYGLALPSQHGDGSLREQLRLVVPMVAISIVGLIYVALLVGCVALHIDRKVLLDVFAKLKVAHPDFPNVQVPWHRFWLGLLAPLVLPLVLIAAWLFLLLWPGV
jgi:hypothetical protein